MTNSHNAVEDAPDAGDQRRCWAGAGSIGECCGGAPADIECLDASLSAEAIAERFSFEGARLVAAEAVKLPVRVSPEYRFVVIAVAQPKTWDPEEPWGSDGQACVQAPDEPRAMLAETRELPDCLMD